MKLMRSFLILPFTSAILFQTSAATLLIEQTHPYLSGSTGYGYGLSDWTGMTSALNNAFGAANITVSTSPLNNLAYLLSFDRLWVTPPNPEDNLTAQEIANIQAFIATGRRVILLGENNTWSAWNSSILQTVGGTYGGVEISGGLAPVLVHPLTMGVTSLTTISDGVANGGTSLFSQNVATLWGPSQSVLSLLSVNVIDDEYGASASNQQFMHNMAQWLAVPEPSVTALVIVGLLCLLSRGRGCNALQSP